MVLGDHACSVDCVGINAHDGELLFEILCAHTDTILKPGAPRDLVGKLVVCPGFS
jgi:hypothetical protein